MTPVSPTHVLFLGLRVLGVLVGFQFFVSVATVAWLVSISQGHETLAGLSPVLAQMAIRGVAGFWLFFFPDKTAMTVERWTSANLSSIGLGLAGLTLAISAASDLPSQISFWQFERTHGAYENQLPFVYGFLPNSPGVARACLMLVGGLLLLAFARWVANWTDPEWRLTRSAVREAREPD